MERRPRCSKCKSGTLRCNYIWKYGECSFGDSPQQVKSHRSSLCHCYDFSALGQQESDELRQIRQRLANLERLMFDTSDKSWRFPASWMLKKVLELLDDLTEIVDSMPKRAQVTSNTKAPVEVSFPHQAKELQQATIVALQEAYERDVEDARVKVFPQKEQILQPISISIGDTFGRRLSLICDAQAPRIDLKCSQLAIKGTAKVELRGLRLHGTQLSHPLICISEEADVCLVDCVLSACGNGVKVSGSAKLKMSGCEIQNCGCSGLWVADTDGMCQIEKCKIRNNKSAGIVIGGANVSEGTCIISQTLVKDNETFGIKMFADAKAVWQGKAELLTKNPEGPVRFESNTTNSLKGFHAVEVEHAPEDVEDPPDLKGFHLVEKNTFLHVEDPPDLTLPKRARSL